MKVHFISIGGSAMHNLAIALKLKGYNVTGSDDKIFEPSSSRLQKYGLMPDKFGWDKSRISNNIDFRNYVICIFIKLQSIRSKFSLFFRPNNRK